MKSVSPLKKLLGVYLLKLALPASLVTAVFRFVLRTRRTLPVRTGFPEVKSCRREAGISESVQVAPFPTDKVTKLLTTGLAPLVPLTVTATGTAQPEMPDGIVNATWSSPESPERPA